MDERQILKNAALLMNFDTPRFCEKLPWTPCQGISTESGEYGAMIWNPLVFDLHAFHLQIEGGFHVSIIGDECWAQKYIDEEEGWLTCKEKHNGDKRKATRFAITKLASNVFEKYQSKK